MTVGWKLDGKCRDDLLTVYPPRYERTVADHVTLSISGTEAPAPVHNAVIIGQADDGKGVEAFIVAIDGSTSRPDGGTWHVTWSLSEGRAPRESNDVIAEGGWTPIPPIALSLNPALW